MAIRVSRKQEEVYLLLSFGILHITRQKDFQPVLENVSLQMIRSERNKTRRNDELIEFTCSRVPVWLFLHEEHSRGIFRRLVWIIGTRFFVIRTIRQTNCTSAATARRFLRNELIADYIRSSVATRLIRLFKFIGAKTIVVENEQCEQWLLFFFFYENFIYLKWYRVLFGGFRTRFSLLIKLRYYIYLM